MPPNSQRELKPPRTHGSSIFPGPRGESMAVQLLCVSLRGGSGVPEVAEGGG